MTCQEELALAKDLIRQQAAELDALRKRIDELITGKLHFLPPAKTRQ